LLIFLWLADEDYNVKQIMIGLSNDAAGNASHLMDTTMAILTRFCTPSPPGYLVKHRAGFSCKAPQNAPNDRCPQ
jgi:hypothetical protein